MLVEQERFDLYFDGYERSAWRFEAQPTYTMSDENVDLSRFLAEEPMPPDFNEEWHERVRSMVAAGKTIARVRMVRRPLTDYQRYHGRDLDRPREAGGLQAGAVPSLAGHRTAPICAVR